MKKQKNSAQLTVGTLKWAEARLKEVGNCPVAQKIVLDNKLISKPGTPKGKAAFKI